MQFGKSVGIACSSFAVTNIDDMFVLVTFFAEASSNHASLTPLKITLGQYIGFTVIVIVSMIGFGASLLLPYQPIGFLGLLPILLGVWNGLNLLLSKITNEPEEEDENTNIAGIKSLLKVSLITIINGGDNIGTYIPLFSQAKGGEIAIYIVVYYILVGVWCLIAFLVMRQKQVLAVVQKYVQTVLPLLYIGLGIYIIVKSNCYPWSIQHIDAKTNGHPGKIIMGMVTTGVVLLCMGAMLWLKMRKRRGKAKMPKPMTPTSGTELTRAVSANSASTLTPSSATSIPKDEVIDGSLADSPA